MYTFYGDLFKSYRMSTFDYSIDFVDLIDLYYYFFGKCPFKILTDGAVIRNAPSLVNDDWLPSRDVP